MGITQGDIHNWLYKNILPRASYRVAQISVSSPSSHQGQFQLHVPDEFNHTLPGRPNIEAATKLNATVFFVSWNKPVAAHLFVPHFGWLGFTSTHGFKFGFADVSPLRHSLQRR